MRHHPPYITLSSLLHVFSKHVGPYDKLRPQVVEHVLFLQTALILG